ncbi:MAG: MarR family transcriptional regulator [Bacteroidota bacterium]
MDRSQAILDIRAFNRFYTNVLFLLDQSVLKSGYSLAEARVMYEVKANGPCAARDIMNRLNIDEGYLSRILNHFVAKELVLKTQSPTDKRQYHLRLSARGRRAYDMLESLANQSIQGLMSHLSDQEVGDLIRHMHSITELLDHEPTE